MNPVEGRPSGWPIASFDNYAQAQAAVDFLSDLEDFPVEELTIVGVDLMQVERVVGRLTWPRVIFQGLLSGVWMGVFFGLLLGFFSEDWIQPLVYGAGLGAVFGLVSSVIPYAASAGRRDFASTSQLVAARYDVLCAPQYATKARDLVANSPVVRNAPQQ